VPLYMKQNGGPAVEAAWADSFLLLGRQLAKHQTDPQSQVILVVTVPILDYAACLIGVGWRLSKRREYASISASSFKLLRPGNLIALATGNRVRCGIFHGWDENKKRINIDGIHLSIDSVLYANIRENGIGSTGYRDIPRPASILAGTWLEGSWIAANAEVDHDVAIVGVKRSILAESETLIGLAPDSMNALGDILTVPESTSATSWCATIVPSTDGGRSDLDAGASLVILDGTSAARWLRTVESQFIVCVVDRSQDHESFDESVLRIRAGGVPLENGFLDWTPPPGIEVLGFEVPL
jgi:hypothetical protein